MVNEGLEIGHFDQALPSRQLGPGLLLRLLWVFVGLLQDLLRQGLNGLHLLSTEPGRCFGQPLIKNGLLETALVILGRGGSLPVLAGLHLSSAHVLRHWCQQWRLLRVLSLHGDLCVGLGRDRVFRPSSESQAPLSRVLGCFGESGSTSRLSAPFPIEATGSHLQITRSALLRSHSIVVTAQFHAKGVSWRAHSLWRAGCVGAVVWLPGEGGG